MQGLLTALKGSRTAKSMLFHEYFIQNTKYLAIMHLKKITKPLEAEIQQLKKSLPKKADSQIDPQFRRTLVLDLDETLVHCRAEGESDCQSVPDFKLQLENQNCGQTDIQGFFRPYCKEFISELSKLYEIVIFTAASEEYANKVIDYIDPQGEYISHRLFRNSCVEKSGLHIKDLRVLLDRDLKDVIFVDNFIYSYAFHLENGVPILPYFGSKDDYQLQDLSKLLQRFAMIDKSVDMRQVIGGLFRSELWDKFGHRQDVLSRNIINWYKKLDSFL